MADDPGSGTSRLNRRFGTGPSSPSVGRARFRRSRTVFPTVFGAVVIATVISTPLFSLSVADPSVMGLVWAGLAAVAAVGIVFPLVSLGLLRMGVVSSPQDLTVGQLSSIEIELTGRASGLRIRCGRSPMHVLDLTSPAKVKIPLEVAERGVYDHIPIEVSTDAPFSVLTVSERRIAGLKRSMVVGPRVIPGVANVGEITGDDHERPSSGHSTSGDTVRSVRPYVTGDPAHMVHWPSSARMGSLVVRELEPPRTEGVAVVLRLVGEAGSEELEHAVSSAAGIALNALDRGARVMLCTATTTGPLSGEVLSPLALQRRLAGAEAGTPGAPPDGWPTQLVSELVSELISDRPGADGV